MTGKSTLRRDILTLMGGNSAFVLFQLGVVISITHFTSTAEVGLYGASLALATIVFSVTNLGLRLGYATAPEAHATPAPYITVRLALTAVGVAAILGLGALFNDGLARPALIVFMVALFKSAEAVSDLLFGILQRRGLAHKVGYSQALRGAGSFALCLLLLWRTGDLAIALLAQILVWWSVTLFHDLRAVRAGGGLELTSDIPTMTAVCRQSAPLGVANVLTSVSSNAPRILIAAIMGLSAAGVFTAVGYVLQLSAILSATLANAMATRLSNHFAQRDFTAFRRDIWRLVKPVGALAIVGIASAAVLGGWILQAVFGADYAGYGVLLVWLTATMGARFLVAILQTALIATRAFTKLALIRLAVSIAVVTGTALAAYLGTLNTVGMTLLVIATVQSIATLLLLRAHIVTAEHSRKAAP